MGARDLGRLRKICLALPDAHEVLTWGDHPTFRVGKKIFVVAGADGESLSVKADPEEKRALLDSGDDHYYRPPYVDTKGWLGVRIDKSTDWDEVGELVTTSWALIAPKRLVKAHLGA